MMSWYESRIDREIREAQERGEFDDLPGAGKPLPDLDDEYDENWWIKRLVRRERITGMVPATLALRKEVEDLAGTVAQLRTESSVRRLVAELNDRIRRAQRGHLDGPSVVLAAIDADEVVRVWHDRRR